MKAIKTIIYSGRILGLCFCGMLALVQARAAESNLLPPVIQKGLSLYERNGPDLAFDAFQHGGLLEGDAKLVRAFKEIANQMGNYQSSEVIAIKEIAKSSRIVYLSMDFKRGAIYARFLIYKAETDWVVQNMNFSTRPEAVMPWLALAGEADSQ